MLQKLLLPNTARDFILNVLNVKRRLGTADNPVQAVRIAGEGTQRFSR